MTMNPANILYICLLSLLLLWNKPLFLFMRKIISIAFLMLLGLAVFSQESYPIKVNKKWGLINADGDVIARVETYEPVSENPVFSIQFPSTDANRVINVSGRDNNGNVINAEIQ